MSKSKKSYKDLCKELQLLQDQQKNMVEAGAKVFLLELTEQDESIKKFLADAKPAELKQKAIEVAPVLVRSINSTDVRTHGFNN